MKIAIEGPDGTGKTTVTQRVVSALKGRYVPGCSDSPIGKLVRRGLLKEELMNPVELQAAYTADRMARDYELRTYDGIGDHLVFDRWTMSALVYGVLHWPEEETSNIEFHRKWLLNINASVMVPDFYIVLKVPNHVAVERIAARKASTGTALEIYEKPSLVNRVSRGYEEVARYFPRHVVVNADRPVEDVCKSVMAVASQLIAQEGVRS